VSVTSIENARDLGALTARIGDVFQVWVLCILASGHRPGARLISLSMPTTFTLLRPLQRTGS